MRRLCFVMALAWAVAGCDPTEAARSECGPSKSCPSGQYCAQTPDGSVCWQDTQPPVVTGVDLACASPCLRDSVVTITAQAADDHALEKVQATLDLDATRTVPLSKVGGTWTASVRLDEFAFPHFEGGVVAAVTAIDGAGNASAPRMSEATVATRLLFAVPADTGFVVGLTAPAVAADGTVVVGGNNGKVYFIGQGGTQVRDPVAVGTDTITSAPSIGPDAIWIGSKDGKLYGLNLDGTPGSTCATGLLPVTSAAIAGSRVVAGSEDGLIFVADLAGTCKAANVGAAVNSPPAILSSGRVVAVAGSKLRTVSLPASGYLVDEWTSEPPAPTIGTVTSPPALDAADSVWSLATDGQLARTTTAAVTSPMATLPAGSAGAIVLADGSVVAAGSDSSLHRLMQGGTPPWTQSVPLLGQPTIPLALRSPTENPLGDTLLVPSSTGSLYAVETDTGSVSWSVKLSATSRPLQPANVAPRPGGRTSTAYVTGADGKLTAIIVDGTLDASAPWPKAFHDARNSSNAGGAP